MRGIELIDTGVFNEDRYFDVSAEYAKGSENDVLIRLTVANRGPEKATLHLLPTLWFRNTWSWGEIAEECTSKPLIALERDGLHMFITTSSANIKLPTRVTRRRSSPRTKRILRVFTVIRMVSLL